MQQKGQTPWKTDRWWTSPYNFDTEVTRQHHFSEGVEIHDVTLRDGEQTPGVVFTKQEKLDIALKVDEAKVHRIEAGMPIVSDEDRDAIKAIAKNVAFSRVFCFCRARKEDIDASIDCDVSSIIIELPALEARLNVMGYTIHDAASKAAEVIEYAKDHGLFVVFFPFETTRSDFDSIRQMVEAGESAHADRLAVVDTVSAASPDGFAHLVMRVRKIVKTPLEVHCHNSLGLGTANSLAGLSAGGKAAHVSVNGIGEAGGNVATEELVMALKLLYGIDCGVDIPKLHEASKLVEKFSGIPIPVNKPVFGANLFRRESGIVVERYYKMPEVAKELELFDPAWLGTETEIVLGKKSGKYSILLALQKLGLAANDEQVQKILQAVKQKSISKKSLVTSEEFAKIVTEIT